MIAASIIVAGSQQHLPDRHRKPRADRFRFRPVAWLRFRFGAERHGVAAWCPRDFVTGLQFRHRDRAARGRAHCHADHLWNSCGGCSIAVASCLGARRSSLPSPRFGWCSARSFRANGSELTAQKWRLVGVLEQAALTTLSSGTQDRQDAGVMGRRVRMPYRKAQQFRDRGGAKFAPFDAEAVAILARHVAIDRRGPRAWTDRATRRLSRPERLGAGLYPLLSGRR